MRIAIRRIAATLALAALVRPAPATPVDDPAIQSPLAPESLLVSIVRNDGRLVAVGEQGHIIYSDDGAASWTHAEVPLSLMLTSVCFATPDLGWAVGHQGVILATTDRGETWQMQLDGREIARMQHAAAEAALAEQQRAFEELPEDADIEEAEYALEDAEFALEDAAARLEDGILSPLLRVACTGEREAYALGSYGVVLRTRDGGETWDLVSRQFENPDGFHWYTMVRAGGTLFIAGEGGLLNRSTDGGQTWEGLDAGYDGSFFGAVTPTGGGVLLFGLRGNIFRSDDGGDSWRAVRTQSTSTLTGGTTLADGSIVLVGANGRILESDDGGETFRRVDSNTRLTLSDVIGTQGGGLIAVGFGGVRKLAGPVAGPAGE